MRFLFPYPERSGADAELLDAGPVGELARAAEDAGFAGFGFTEHPAPSATWLASGGHQTLDPFVALAFAAAATSRIALVTYLTVMPYRNPLLLAKSAASVDILSGGRFVLGVGAGYLKGEFRALGVDFDERNELFDEALDVLPLHWSGEPFSYTGRHFECREVMARPRPPAGTIPIWIGGNSALTRRRVAERAQGWMPLTGPAELFRTTRTPPLTGLDDVSAAVSDLRSAAGGRADIDVVLTYPDRSIGRPGADLGPVREQVAAYEAAGVTWLTVSCASISREESLRFLDRFGEECIR